MSLVYNVVWGENSSYTTAENGSKNTEKQILFVVLSSTFKNGWRFSLNF